MPTMDIIFTFAVVSFLLSISPGPSVLYIMARSVSQGPKAGFSAAGGMAIGSFIYVLATVLGISAIFQYSPMAYLAVKVFGAGYLLYLGVQYFRAEPVVADSSQKVEPLSNARILRQSVIVELTNPKTALFFLAFLPQFVKVEQGSMGLQLVVLGLVYALVALSCDMCVALLSGKLGVWLAQHPRAIRIQDRIAGSVLVFLGLYIGYEAYTD